MEFLILREVRRQGGEEVFTSDLLSALKEVFPDLDRKTLNSELYRMEGKTLTKTAEKNGTKPRWTLLASEDSADRLEQLLLIQAALEEEIRELQDTPGASKEKADVPRGLRRRGKAAADNAADNAANEKKPKPKAKVISRAKKPVADDADNVEEEV